MFQSVHTLKLAVTATAFRYQPGIKMITILQCVCFVEFHLLQSAHPSPSSEGLKKAAKLSMTSEGESCVNIPLDNSVRFKHSFRSSKRE